MTRRPTDFDAMTCIGIAAGMLLLAEIGIIAGKDIAARFQQERIWDDEPRRQAVDRTAPGCANRAEAQPASGGAATRPAPRLSPVPHDDGRTGHVGRRETFICTGYCACAKCTNKHPSDLDYGRTASGEMVSRHRSGLVAADKRIPFHTWLRVPGYNGGEPVEVLDRGGAIKGNRLDLFFGGPGGHKAALAFGRKTLVCEVLP